MSDPLDAAKATSAPSDSLLALLSAWRTAGGAKSVESLCAAQPHLAEPLRKLIVDTNLLNELVNTSSEQASADFEMLDRIGEGGNAIVWRARQKSTQRIVAFKRLRDRISSFSSQRRFEREIACAGRLVHPGIVRVYSAGVDRHGVFCAMELVDGVTLDKHARANPHSHEQAIRTVLRLTEAVGYAHQNAVLHCDLTPRNVMIRQDGSPVVLDFGLARELHTDGHALRSLVLGEGGTPAYMSPEQISADGPIDVRSDVWALGVILFELVLHRRPFDRPGANAVMQQILSDPLPRPRSIDRTVSADLEAVILKATAKEPAARYPSADALANDLRALLDRHPVSARRATPIYLAERFVRRHRLACAVTAATLLSVGAIIVGAFVMVLQQRQLAERERDQATAARLIAEEQRQDAMLSVSILETSIAQVSRLESVELRAALKREVKAAIDYRISDHTGTAAQRARVLALVIRDFAELLPVEQRLSMAQEIVDSLKHELGPEHPEIGVALVRVGVVLLSANENAKALAVLRQAEPSLRMHPDYRGEYDLASCLQRIAQAQLGTSPPDARAAIAHLDEALRIAPEIPHLSTDHRAHLRAFDLHLRGVALAQLGQTREAIECLRRSIELRLPIEVNGRFNHHSLGAQQYLTSLLIAEGRLDEAAVEARINLEHRIRVHGSRADLTRVAYALMGRIALRQDQPDEARDWFLQAITDLPDDPTLRSQLRTFQADLTKLGLPVPAGATISP